MSLDLTGGGKYAYYDGNATPIQGLVNFHPLGWCGYPTWFVADIYPASTTSNTVAMLTDQNSSIRHIWAFMQSGTFRARTSSGFDSQVNISTNQWSRVVAYWGSRTSRKAVVGNGGTVTLGTANTTDYTWPTIAGFVIGARWYSGGVFDNTYSGLIANVALGNVPLSDAQLTDLGTPGSNPLRLGATRFWDLDGDANDHFGAWNLTLGGSAGFSATRPTVPLEDWPPASGGGVSRSRLINSGG